MTDLIPFLKKMLTAPGLSGFESPIRAIIEDAWMPITDEMSVSKIGSLHGLKKRAGQ